MPFILRAVSLLGINSVDTPSELRHTVWQRLASDLAPQHLDVIGERIVEFAELPQCFDGFLKGEVRGRVVVRIDSN
jgi:NADPH:quinone reductase-like Zn-dependent oxidoreductase